MPPTSERCKPCPCDRIRAAEAGYIKVFVVLKPHDIDVRPPCYVFVSTIAQERFIFTKQFIIVIIRTDEMIGGYTSEPVYDDCKPYVRAGKGKVL